MKAQSIGDLGGTHGILWREDMCQLYQLRNDSSE